MGGDDAAVLWLFFGMRELPRWNSPEVHLSGQSGNGRSQRREKGQLQPPPQSFLYNFYHLREVYALK